MPLDSTWFRTKIAVHIYERSAPRDPHSTPILAIINCFEAIGAKIDKV